MPLLERESKTNIILLLLMTILGLTAVFEADYSHEMVYYSYFVVVPVTMYYLLKQVPGNYISLRVHLPFVIFLIINALSLLWTININETLGELYKLGFYAILYYLTAAYLREKDVEKLITTVLIIGTFIALLGIMLFLFVKSQRIISVFNNSNPFGMYLAMLSLTGMGVYLHRTKNIWLIFSLVIITSALVLTGSRGSLISYAVVFPLLFLFISRDKFLIKIGKSLLIFLIVSISVFIISSVAPWVQNMGMNTSPFAVDTLNKIVIRDSSIGSSSVIGRLSFWQVALNMAMVYPFTGLGLGTYHIAYNSFRNDDKWWSMFAHNNYLQMWAETGIFALISFVVFFFLFFALAIREIEEINKHGLYRGLLAACLAFLLHIFVDFTWNMPTVTILFWVFLGCITALQSKDNYNLFENKKRIIRYIASALIFLLLLGSGQQLAAYRMAVLGEIAQNQENYEEAINKYQTACRIFPYRAEYYGNISGNYYSLFLKSKKQTHLEQAIDYRKKAIDQSPYDYEHYGFLGFILWQHGLDEAEDYLRQAVKLGGFIPRPFTDLGYYYLSKEKWTEGEQVLLQGLEQSVFAYQNAPDKSSKAKIVEEQVKMHLGLALVYNEQRLRDKEKEHLEKAIELDPENAVALRHLEKF